MPFDLTMGMDNLYTLIKITTTNHLNNNNIRNIDCVLDNGNMNIDDDMSTNDDDDDDTNNIESSQCIYEYFNSELINIRYVIDQKNSLQLLVRVSSFKYEFAFQHQQHYHFEHTYILTLLSNKYNNYFLLILNKKLLFENNWQIPQVKAKQRPTEFYEIYRFIEHKFVGSISNMEQLFDLMPKHLVNRNVNIGSADEIINEIKKVPLP